MACEDFGGKFDESSFHVCDRGSPHLYFPFHTKFPLLSFNALSTSFLRTFLDHKEHCHEVAGVKGQSLYIHQPVNREGSC